MTKIKIKLEDGARLPERKTNGSACFDAYANECRIIEPNQTVIVSLGIRTEFDDGYYLEVRGRSGNTSKGILVGLGTVDSDYRGIIGAIVTNLSKTKFEIQQGDRIAQLMLKKIEPCVLEEVEELSETDRGEGGFGSTGK